MDKKNISIVVIVCIVLLIGFILYQYNTGNENNISQKNSIEHELQIQGQTYSLTGNNLNFDSKGLTQDELQIIAEKIKNNTSIETIYLGGNHITKVGLDYLSTLNTPSLKVIDLSNNSIGDEGMTNFLEKNFFRVVDVSGNNLTDVCVKHFDKNMKTAYLSINRNQLTNEGLKSILKNTNLEYLSIENNLLTDEVIKYLVPNGSGTNLQYIRLTGNNFSEDGKKKLDELKKKKIFKTLEY